MRAPNVLIFLFTLILGFIGVGEHLGIPVDIPERALPLIGSTKEIAPFLAAHSFWVVFTAWLLLAIGVFLPRRATRRGAVLSR
jgi:heme/copper-type cytochrome/quinol oxidase subunit 1